MNKWMSVQNSIGIIGGADGPTSIFIAGKVGTGDIVLGLVVAVAVILGVIWLVRRKK